MTGIELFKTQALKGLSTYMADWPKIVATESITEELSRLLLPLAWRVRVEDTPAHRAELRECWEALKRNWTCNATTWLCSLRFSGSQNLRLSNDVARRGGRADLHHVSVRPDVRAVHDQPVLRQRRAQCLPGDRRPRVRRPL